MIPQPRRYLNPFSPLTQVPQRDFPTTDSLGLDLHDFFFFALADFVNLFDERVC